MNQRVATTSRFAQWCIDGSNFPSPLTSLPFKIGHWSWMLVLENYNHVVRLVPMSCEHGPPIASFNMRLVSLVGGRKALASTVIRDEECNWKNGFVWMFSIPLTSGVIVEVEFRDLKTACPKGEPRSIWSERCIQKVTAASSLGRMLSESIHTDITILASDGSIGAHRAVLAAHSPVFDRMFIHDLKEKESSSINIPDMPIVVCQAFLSYLYSNNIQYQDFLTHRLGLLKAADKYDITDLKDACQESLTEDIDTENVLERLQTACMYRLPRLKVCCIEYLVKFGKIFDIKEEFNAFVQSADRELVSEVVNEMSCVWKGV